MTQVARAYTSKTVEIASALRSPLCGVRVPLP